VLVGYGLPLFGPAKRMGVRRDVRKDRLIGCFGRGIIYGALGVILKGVRGCAVRASRPISLTVGHLYGAAYKGP
jgi:hypothetical protein